MYIRPLSSRCGAMLCTSGSMIAKQREKKQYLLTVLILDIQENLSSKTLTLLSILNLPFTAKIIKKCTQKINAGILGFYSFVELFLIPIEKSRKPNTNTVFALKIYFEKKNFDKLIYVQPKSNVSKSALYIYNSIYMYLTYMIYVFQIARKHKQIN